jgi:hypothetical protein
VSAAAASPSLSGVGGAVMRIRLPGALTAAR